MSLFRMFIRLKPIDSFHFCSKLTPARYLKASLSIRESPFASAMKSAVSPFFQQRTKVHIRNFKDFVAISTICNPESQSWRVDHSMLQTHKHIYKHRPRRRLVSITSNIPCTSLHGSPKQTTQS